jgi:hypothetical protein
MSGLSHLIAKYAYTMRARLSPHHSVGLRAITLGLVALGLLLIAEDRTVAGVFVLMLSVMIAWLIGLWVAPWGRESYSRKLSGIMRVWVAELQVDQSREKAPRLERAEMIEKSVSRCLGRMQKLKPPAVWRADHSRHLDALKEYRAVLKNYRDVCGDGDCGAVQKAAEKVLQSRQALDDESRTFSAKLREGWSIPPV